jgi:hypothetical protein
MRSRLPLTHDQINQIAKTSAILDPAFRSAFLSRVQKIAANDNNRHVNNETLTQIIEHALSDLLGYEP